MKNLDIAIVGGGISGLYFLYQIIKKSEKGKKKLSIHLYEKSDVFGGRISTFQKKIQNQTYPFEAGAARFCKNKHLRFYRLIQEFRLKKYLVPGSANIQFIPSSQKYFTNPTYRKIAQKSPYDFIQKVISKSALFSKQIMMKYSFIDFVKKKKLLTSEEATYLLDSFGYSGEINSMNAYNALHMFKTDLNKKYTYYSLSCGLSHLIDKMIQYIKTKSAKYGHHIILHKNSSIINVTKKNHFLCKIQDHVKNEIKYVTAKKIVFAIQKAGLLQLSLLRPYQKLLHSVDAKSLCRIYMIFQRGTSCECMNDLSKITTDTQNRYLIPLDKKNGSVMISYTDSTYADHLYQYYEKYGTAKLESYILDSWSSTLHRNIPKPIFTKVCYWKEGIAMWKPKHNSLLISKKVRNPMKNVYIIGENYSLNQAWIEGALQTCDDVLKKLKT